jgi:hypothetical protein
MNKKTLMLTSVTLIAILTISMIGISYANWWGRYCKPKISIYFVSKYTLGEYSYEKELPGNWKMTRLPVTGTVTLAIFQWLPNEEGTDYTYEGMTHLYFGMVEGETTAKFDVDTGEGTYCAERTYTFNIKGEISTFVIKIKYNGVGFDYAGTWSGFGTGIFKGIKASGIATADGNPPPPSEAKLSGIVQRGHANLPPSNYPSAP